MLKAALNYLDNEIEAVQLEGITPDMLKVDNIKKANINKSIKEIATGWSIGRYSNGSTATGVGSFSC
jgi:hypothetical protein